MAVDDCNLDIGDLQDLILDSLEKGHDGWPSFSDFPKSQLCVPPDPIEDLEWFPSFHDNFISLKDVGLTPEHESYCSEPNQHLLNFDIPVTPEHLDKKAKQQNLKSKQVMHQNHNDIKKDEIKSLQRDFIGFTRKKARTKNQKPKWAVTWLKKRCSHCHTEETPQWRVGPMGPKTLCNACGVRFKSGRLVPEYRPANSPTFDGGRHSNYHKNILKRRSSNSF